MDPHKVMSAYNAHERIGLTVAGCEKIETPNLVKLVSDTHYGSLISYYDLTPVDLSIYVIYEAGVRVSSARIDYNGDSPFAGVWGGGRCVRY